MSLDQLNKLVSLHNLRLTKNDRKFYKKFNYRLGFYYTQGPGPWEGYYTLLNEMKQYADLNWMQMRRERSKINIYSEDVYGLAKFMELHPGMDYVEASYWPEDISYKIKLRKTEPEYPWEVKLSRNVNKDHLKNFYKLHKNTMWINRDSKYELDIQNFWQNNMPHWKVSKKSQTWSTTTWRFNDEDIKNLFLFTFGEYIVDEAFYKKEK